MLFSVLTWAETATATDETSEAVVVGKIIKDQQQTAQNSNTILTAPEIKIQAPTVANDMAEGESIRGLPTLNEPVVDQANLLNASQKQDISQRILALHKEGKAQIGVVIVPTTGQEDILILPCELRKNGNWVRPSRTTDCSWQSRSMTVVFKF